MQYTRAQLRSQARVAADQDTGLFPTDAAYNDIIDRAADFVWRKMVAIGWKPAQNVLHMDATGTGGLFAFGERVAVVDTIFPVNSFTSTAPIGPELRRVKPEDLPILLSAQPSSSFATHYDLQSGSTSIAPGSLSLAIKLYPVPTSGFYTALYQPQFAGFVNDSDIWAGPEGSGELIILQSAIEGARKEGDPADIIPSLQKQLDARTQEVVDYASFLFDPQTVRDRRDRRYPRQFGYNAAEAWDD